jgi:chaperonin GroES
VWIEVDEERLLVCRVGELLGVIEEVADREYEPAR